MALLAGFLTTLLLQAYVWDSIMAALHPEWVGMQLAFPYQLCIGTFVSLCVCLCGKATPQEQDQLQAA